ncbi:MAG: fucose pyrophosphorylase domain-containing protein, partial [Phycisphaerales bacterium]
MNAVPECGFNDVVLTASGDSQAAGYRAELNARRARGLLPHGVEFHVVPDPGGRRVGSGAATCVAIQTVARAHGLPPARLVENRRVLILHSGGDARRLPAYAAQGKVFLPLPRSDERGAGFALFDLLLQDLASPTLGEGGRLVIAAGDLYLALARQPLNLGGDDFVGVAFRGTADTGTRHGVYVAYAEGHIETFLQKPTLEYAAASRAIDPEGFVLVDTGVVSLSSRGTGAMLHAALAGGKNSLVSLAIDGRSPPLDLYEHILIGLLSNSTPAEFADTLGANPAHAAALRALKSSLASLTCRVRVAPHSRFLHVGTTREMLERLGPGFAEDPKPGGLVFNSIAHAGISAKGSYVVESCELRRRPKLDGDNVLVGVPSVYNNALHLRKGLGLVVLPISTDRWSAIVFGDRDDFKTTFVKGGTFLNRPFGTAIDEASTLWNAPLFKVGTLPSVIAHAERLMRGGAPGSGELRSAAWLMQQVNHARLLDARALTQRRARLHALVNRIESHPWLSAADIVADAPSRAEAKSASLSLQRASATRPATVRARMLHNASRLSTAAGRPKDALRLAESAFGAVRASVVPAEDRATPVLRPGILEDQVVWATCPARID